MKTVHFLSADDGTRLTKRFHLADGQLVKEPYPNVYAVNSYPVEVHTIEDFFDAVTSHAEKGHCLLKGQLDRRLTKESRAGHTQTDTATDWLVLDNDNLHDLEPQALLALLGLGDVDHVVQYSASAGVVPGARGYHIFLMLDRPWAPADLKLWLRAWNLDVPQIREHFRLSRTKNSLRWPLDITVCQNDKLIYIAPPTLGPGVSSSIEGDRIQLVRNGRPAASLHPAAEDDQLLAGREAAVLNALRQKAGLPPKEHQTRQIHNTQVVANPDQAQVTGRKEERGFVYLNLNGGDSWAYYHKPEAPEILYNFKSEPNYLIEQLLPDYYPEAVARSKEVKQEQNLERKHADMAQQVERAQRAEENGDKFLLAFRDRTSDSYYAGWIDPKTRTHDLCQVGNKGKIKDLFTQHGYAPIEVVPTVDYNFEPANDALYDFERGFVNRYTPPPLRQAARSRPDAEIPPAVKRVIEHALGGDPTVVEHFLNWVAVLFSTGTRTESGWLLQGTTGTGKGILVNQILKPLVGEQYCRSVNLGNLEEKFTAFAEGTILLFIDEVDTDQVKDMAKLMARFKRWITESTVSVRAMNQNLREPPNYLNLILASNQPNSLRIEANDRRFNVCPRQEGKLLAPGEDGAALVAQLQTELPAFADYLMSREADPAKARLPLDNEPKRQLQKITQTAAEEVVAALKAGDLAYFVENRPMEAGGAWRRSEFDGSEVYAGSLYMEALREALTAARANRRHILRHPALFGLFHVLVGDMPRTKGKLAKRLGHLGLNVDSHTEGSSSVRGISVRWKADVSVLDAWSAVLVDPLMRTESGRMPREPNLAEEGAAYGARP